MNERESVIMPTKRESRPRFDSALICTRALAGAIGTATFHRSRLRGALDLGHLCATDVADQLVTLGVPFREAHHAVGKLVRRAEELGLQLDKLPRAELAAVHPGMTPERIDAVLSVEAAVERRALLGGPARARVLEAVAEARARWAAAGERH